MEPKQNKIGINSPYPTRNVGKLHDLFLLTSIMETGLQRTWERYLSNSARLHQTTYMKVNAISSQTKRLFEAKKVWFYRRML